MTAIIFRPLAQSVCLSPFRTAPGRIVLLPGGVLAVPLLDKRLEFGFLAGSVAADAGYRRGFHCGLSRCCRIKSSDEVGDSEDPTVAKSSVSTSIVLIFGQVGGDLKNLSLYSVRCR